MKLSMFNLLTYSQLMKYIADIITVDRNEGMRLTVLLSLTAISGLQSYNRHAQTDVIQLLGRQISLGNYELINGGPSPTHYLY